MGNLCSLCSSCSFLKREDKKELEDHLIRGRHCYKCQITYLSNYEYNKHIIDCNQVHGDM